MSSIADWSRERLHRRPSYQRWQASHIRLWLRRAWEFCQRHRFAFLVLLVLAYRLMLDLLYMTVISPLYAYSGFLMNFHPLFYSCTLLALTVFLPAVVRLQEEGTPSANIVTFLNYIYFIPLTSYCGCNWSGMGFFLTGLAYWAVLLLIQFLLPVLSFKPFSGDHRRGTYMLLTVFAVGVVMYVSGRYAGFRLTFDIFDVYGIRAEAAAYSLPSLIAYALSMAGNVLAILLIYWLLRRKYMVCAVLVVVYMFLFSVAGHKSLFFFLLLVLAGYFFFRSWMRQWLPMLTSLAALAALIEYRFVHSFYLTSYMFRRVMYEPVNLSKRYMEFFQENPLSLFRSGILRFFSFSSNYSTSLAHLLGEVDGAFNAANNGMLGDMFANLPTLLGIFIMPLILVFCFRLLDAVATHLPEKLVISSCVYFAVSFSNTFWSTVLLSHGFLITCLLLYIFPKKEELSQ